MRKWYQGLEISGTAGLLSFLSPPQFTLCSAWECVQCSFEILCYLDRTKSFAYQFKGWTISLAHTTRGAD